MLVLINALVSLMILLASHKNKQKKVKYLQSFIVMIYKKKKYKRGKNKIMIRYENKKKYSQT